MKNIIIAITTLCLAACVNGTASDTITKTEPITFEGIPTPDRISPDVIPSTYTENASATIDFSQAFTDLKKVGTLDISFPVSTLSDNGTNLSFVSHMSLTTTPTDNSLPPLTLSDFDVPSSTTTAIEIPISVDGGTLASYFAEGPQTLSFSLTVNVADAIAAGISGGSMVASYTVQANASININKSISNIGH